MQSHSAVGFEVAESPLESRRNFTGDPSANSEVHLWSLWMQRKVVTMEPRNRAKRWPSMLGCPDGTGCTYGPKENLGQSNESVCHRVVHQGSSHHILTWKQISALQWPQEKSVCSMLVILSQKIRVVVITSKPSANAAVSNNPQAHHSLRD